MLSDRHKHVIQHCAHYGAHYVSQHHYLSFIDQTLHYFDRPHEQGLSKPLDSPSAWRGAQLPTLEELAYALSPDEII